VQRTQIFVESELNVKYKGAEHRNILSVSVLCTYENPNRIFSTNIIAALSLSTYLKNNTIFKEKSLMNL